MSLKILVTGDLHIGRRPSKIPPTFDATAFSCAAMWRSIVECAIRREVDLVALTGDIVDHENRFFEATGPLEEGLARLAEAGIPTYAVAGNHDSDVLPRIVDSLASEQFHLLGREGRWEEVVLEREGEPQLRIRGWSFPLTHFPRSPLDGYAFDSDGDLPTLGLLHADLDVRDSQYAPVMRHELAARPVTLWALGHVHTPRHEILESGHSILYPGSPQAMDPGETGVHGPWLIEVDNAQQVRATQLPMSRVRYETLPLDLTDVDSREAFEARVLSGTGEFLTSLSGNTEGLEVLSIRLELVGRTSLCSQLDAMAVGLVDSFERRGDGFTARLERIENNTLPAIDLEELARKHDPPGVLAQTLRSLEGNELDDSLRAMVREACTGMKQAHGSSAYGPIYGDAEPEMEAARERLMRQGMLLLDTLLKQERA